MNGLTLLVAGRNISIDEINMGPNVKPDVSDINSTHIVLISKQNRIPSLPDIIEGGNFADTLLKQTPFSVHSVFIEFARRLEGCNMKKPGRDLDSIQSTISSYLVSCF